MPSWDTWISSKRNKSITIKYLAGSGISMTSPSIDIWSTKQYRWVIPRSEHAMVLAQAHKQRKKLLKFHQQLCEKDLKRYKTRTLIYRVSVNILLSANFEILAFHNPGALQQAIYQGTFKSAFMISKSTGSFHTVTVHVFITLLRLSPQVSGYLSHLGPWCIIWCTLFWAVSLGQFCVFCQPFDEILDTKIISDCNQT